MKLLEPLVVGPLTAPNRVIFGPHETNLGRTREFSERHVAYYERRAAGGAGVIITEEASVHPSDWPYERAPLASESAPGWSDIVQACAPYPTLVLAGIGHSGGQGTSHWSQRELWAPSRVPEVNTREVPKWMETDDIAAVVDGFATAAAAAVAAGCDGVEINAGQHSLVRQFLSGLTNQRDDEWGRDRSRFARHVLAAVRAAVGGDRVVALRLSCDELAPWAGITPEAAQVLAAELVADPSARLDLLTVVRGSIFTVGATRPDCHTPAGFNLDLVRDVRAAVRSAVDREVPVVAQGSIVDVGQAEWALEDGRADAVEMTRAQISDADLVAKVLRGEAERIRPCTLSNQRSQVRDNRNPIITSLGDPRSGHETEDPPVEGTAVDPVAVTVVGAGPGGLEAARVAALRGHEVTLFEASPRLGGMVRTAAAGSAWGRLGLLVDWLEAECRTLGVQIHTERTVDVADLSGQVILATGSRPGRREYRVTRAAVVLTAAQVLDDPEVLPDGGVVIWDPIGGPIAVSVAETLAPSGRSITLATPDQIAGNELARTGGLAPANARLQQAGVRIERRVTLRSVKKNAVVVEDRFSGEESTLRCSALIDAGHRLPDDSLWEAASTVAGVSAQRVGDCVAPRTIHDAILEGRRAAMALG